MRINLLIFFLLTSMVPQYAQAGINIWSTGEIFGDSLEEQAREASYKANIQLTCEQELTSFLSGSQEPLLDSHYQIWRENLFRSYERRASYQGLYFPREAFDKLVPKIRSWQAPAPKD